MLIYIYQYKFNVRVLITLQVETVAEVAEVAEVAVSAPWSNTADKLIS